MHRDPLSPAPSYWHLGALSVVADRIQLHLTPKRHAALCPGCGLPSSRIHSRYRRRPWDVPWAEWPVQLIVYSRRFFCASAACSRKVFTERFPGVLPRYARQTQRAASALLELAHANSAERAAAMALLLGFRTSPDTLIRLQRAEPFDLPSAAEAGVDEFALRRGRTYGTLVVDLERRQPIALWERARAEPLRRWLRAQPQVRVLARDRANAFAQAGRTGAPQALQVADRFHLVKNVGDALQTLLRSRHWAAPPEESEDTSAVEPLPASPASESPLARPPNPRKQALWEAVWIRHRHGESMRAIARVLGLSRITVKRYLQSASPPVYPAHIARRTQLSPYLPYLRQRWREGCHNARLLYGELVQRGYLGGETQVKALVRPWRQSAHPPAHRSVFHAGIFLRPAARLTPEELEDRDRWLAPHPPLAKGYALKERFLDLMQRRDVGALEAWAQAVASSGLRSFVSLARGMRADWAAIQAALTTPWSTGQCEGQICRVKLIKRVGYGWAKPDLLRQRVLHRLAA